MDDTLADPPPASPPLPMGRLLDGRYAVTARIAHGGMATVYRATDTRLDREVALKVMHAELARDEEFVRRFVGEAKSVARLSHQNVVAVFDQGADGPFLYLAMEYVPGRTLKQVLRDSGRFSPATALEIMTGVLDGLAAAHASGIVHRDVKPENVLVTADGRIKVTDFGLARAQSAAGHTRAGLLIGTVAYVPPEQVTGGSTGPGGDVYSAGVVLFELLTGRPPFTGDTPLSVAYQHVNSGVPAPSALVPGIPVSVDQLVLAATSRDPARRPADAAEFGRAVRLVRAEGYGLSEAPWLDLDSPAVTTGSSFGMGEFGGGREDSHTLVVDRGGGGYDGYHGGRRRESLLSRWLFSPRLLIVALVVVLGLGLGFGGWWLTSGRYAQVPAVSGDSVSDATTALTADGFIVKRGGLVHSNTVPGGMVIRTSPSGRVSRGSVIAIVISNGPFTSVVPTVNGETQSAAQAALQRVHLVSAIQKVASAAPVGTVTGTNPPAGTTWPQTKTVMLLVAGGPALPSFVGMNINAATALASQDHVTLQQQPDGTSQQAPGIITGQQPGAGGLVQPGQTVIVQVSTGPQLVNVPDVTGMPLDQATQQLQAAGFQVQVSRFGLSNTVFDYSPAGQAPRGSTITVYVGL